MGGTAVRIALIGTRGVPARYGGFETAVEEVGRRLVERGHDVLVYCRGGEPPRPEHHLGMRLVHLPALRSNVAETLSHTFLSMIHQIRHPADVAVVFNAANAPLLPILRARGVPAAVHVDGLEWQRAKWGPVGRRYYQLAERLAVRWGQALIADARGIQDYYRTRHDAASWFIPYGAPDRAAIGSDRLAEHGLESDGFHLVVARMEPENHVEMAVEGLRRSSARLPLVVVGGSSYNDQYLTKVREMAGTDPRVRLLGPVWDQVVLDQMYAHCRSYVHGHSVGGTNPSLLRAVGAGASVTAYDVSFNREVLVENGQYFQDSDGVATALELSEAERDRTIAAGQRARADVVQRYDWDQVAVDYETLLLATSSGTGRRPTHHCAARSPTLDDPREQP